MKTIKYCLFFITFLVGCGVLESISFNGPAIKADFSTLTTAHIYKHKTSGELLYCFEKHNDSPLNYNYKGTAKVKKSNIVRCWLAN